MSSHDYSARQLRAARQQLIEAGVGERAPAPRTLGVPDAIERSWRRSVVQHAPYASVTPEFRPLSGAGSTDSLSFAATDVLAHWADSLADMRVGLFVSDRTGRIIARRTGESDHERRLDRAFAAEGFDFSETSLGTNGLGTPMEERCAVFVRGAEHFNDALHTLACAGAPVRDTASGRVIGSVALAAPVDSSDPTMLAIARQAARQVEERMAEAAAPDELRSLIARFIDGSAHRPVFALSRAGVLSTTVAVPWLSAGSYVLLWDDLQSGEWAHATRTVSFAGLPGTARRVPTRDGGAVYIVELEPDAGAESSVDVQATGKDPLERLDELSAEAGGVWISGPAGSGKAHLASSWLQRRDGRVPVVVEAMQLRFAGTSERLAAELRAGRSILVRHVEALEGSDVGRLRALMGATDAAGRARLAATFVHSELDPVLCRVVHRTAPELRLPALRDQPKRIVEIAQEIAGRHRATLGSATLQALTRGEWSGDVAELVDLVECLSRVMQGRTIGPELLPVELRTRARNLYGIAASEYRAIEDALRESGGNRSRAAEALGIGRTTLYRKLRAYGLDGSPALT